MQFSKNHYWARLADTLDGHAIDNVVVGVVPRALAGLGNLILVTLPNVGETLAQGAAMTEIESDKAVTNPYTPVPDEITTINMALHDAPTLASTDPSGVDWFFRIKLSNPGQLGALLDEKAYAEPFWAPQRPIGWPALHQRHDSRSRPSYSPNLWTPTIVLVNRGPTTGSCRIPDAAPILSQRAKQAPGGEVTPKYIGDPMCSWC